MQKVFLKEKMNRATAVTNRQSVLIILSIPLQPSHTGEETLCPSVLSIVSLN